jgi:hypothetical protein
MHPASPASFFLEYSHISTRKETKVLPRALDQHFSNAIVQRLIINIDSKSWGHGSCGRVLASPEFKP